jgi:peptidoglycan/xylan/chitin deacetylase (PgdA/CDA1 family)
MQLSQGLTVFLFHSVTDNPSDYLESTGMWTSNSNFRKQILWIQKNFQVIPITELLTSNHLPKNSAIVTFDDAWLGSYEAIKDFLIPNGIPVCYFVNFGTVIDRVDLNASQLYMNKKSKSSLPINATSIEELNLAEFLNVSEFEHFQGPLMSHEQIVELSKSSLLTIGNHLYHHYDSDKVGDDFFLRQLQLNQDQIEAVGFSERIFAFPFGATGINFQQRHLSILKNENYGLVFSADSRRIPDLRTIPACIPRIHFSHLDCRESDFWWATFKNQLRR